MGVTDAPDLWLGKQAQRPVVRESEGGEVSTVGGEHSFDFLVNREVHERGVGELNFRGLIAGQELRDPPGGNLGQIRDSISSLGNSMQESLDIVGMSSQEPRGLRQDRPTGHKCTPKAVRDGKA